MATCSNSNLSGRQLKVAFAQGCGDLDLATATFDQFGSINSKSVDFTANTTDNTSDLSGGNQSTLVTTLGGEVTVSGWFDKNDSAEVGALSAAQQKITKYFIDESQNADAQPCGWLKIWNDNMPLGFYVFCNITQGPGMGGGTNDTVTFSMTFQSTATGVAGTNAIQHFDPTAP